MLAALNISFLPSFLYKILRFFPKSHIKCPDTISLWIRYCLPQKLLNEPEAPTHQKNVLIWEIKLEKNSNLAKLVIG
jgi:hypothetical protein